MITADQLKTVTTLGPKGLAVVLDQSGYSMCSFESATFLGITNGGQFCYKVTYFDEAGTRDYEVGKVFVTFDHSTGGISADF